MMKKNKEFVPIYQMDCAEYYMLLRIRMTQLGYDYVSGVDDRFYDEKTFKNAESLLKGLEKKGFLTCQNDQISIGDGLLGALTNIVESAHCLLFKNGTMEKNHDMLAFYYANDKFCGVLQEKKSVTLVCNKKEDAVYSAFEKKLNTDGVSKNFSAQNWDVLWNGSGAMKMLEKPVRNASLVHVGNRKGRIAFSVNMLCDKKNIQMIRNFADSKMDELERGFFPVSLWKNIIITELQRLRREHNYRQGVKETEEKQIKKSDYQRIIESPGFPQSRLQFVGWTIKNIFRGLPSFVKGLIKKKFIGAIIAAVWALVLFLYNMYITCYYNDTFMLERRSKFGNLSPYLMGGTLRTPSNLKGFDLDVGVIETTFLVAPLFMILTFLVRQIYVLAKKRKMYLWADILGAEVAAWESRKEGFGRGKEFWIPLAVAFGMGFLIMNPITLFLVAILSLIIFVDGKNNGLIQYLMLYSCAAGRKSVEEKRKAEPDLRRISMFFHNFGWGMLIYAIISVILWFAVDYHFWIRLIVSILLICFCVFQVISLGAPNGSKKINKAFLLLVVAYFAASYFGMKYGVVLADDGGISESGGTLLGLIQNAGFSTILGISIMTIGIAVGGPVTWMIAAGTLAGVTTFATGLTNTEAGAYVRKSASQYFTGVPAGENKTLLCTGTELLSFVSGFVNPTAGMGASAVRTLRIGKMTTDTIAIVGDVTSIASDIEDYKNGEKGIGSVIWSVAGLGFDVYGACGDFNDSFDDFAEMASRGDAYEYVDDLNLRQTIQNLEAEKTRKIDASNDVFNSSMDAKIQVEFDELANQQMTYRELIEKTNSGDVSPLPGLTKEASVQRYQQYITEAQENYTQQINNIRLDYEKQAADAAEVIAKEYSGKIATEYAKKGIDWTSKTYSTLSEAGKLYDFYDTNWGGNAPGNEPVENAEVPLPEDTEVGSLETPQESGDSSISNEEGEEIIPDGENGDYNAD